MFNIKLELKIAKRKKNSSAEKSAVRFFIMLGDMGLISPVTSPPPSPLNSLMPNCQTKQKFSKFESSKSKSRINSERCC